MARPIARPIRRRQGYDGGVWILLAMACARSPDPAPAQTLAEFSAPADARSFYVQGLYAEAHGDELRARRSMDWAQRLDRPSPWVYLATARYADRAGDLDRAWLDANLALERAPELPEARELVERLRAARAARTEP